MSAVSGQSAPYSAVPGGEHWKRARVARRRVRPMPTWLHRCFRASFVVLMFLAMVIPNSIKPASAAMLALTALLAWPLVEFNAAFMRVVRMYLAGAAVTLVYLLVGLLHGASDEALFQVLFIYIVSPALWLLIAGGVIATFRPAAMERMMAVYAVLGALTVPLFFHLFLTGGPQAVSFFIDPEQANVNLQDGYAGATMFVYGTLIFMVSALFAMLAIGVTRVRLLLILGVLVLVAVTSSRSALMLAVPLGLVVGALLRPGLHGPAAAGWALVLARQLGLGLLAALSFVVLLSALSEIDVLYILSDFWAEVTAGGGSERTGQADALFEGIVQTYGLGAGHGIGVAYLRSEDYPWRYEIVPLATVYRVGVIGALVYAWPFIRYGWGVYEVWCRRRLTAFDAFLFAGCLSAFIASATNPYIEAYTFHWMYVLPVAIFLVRHPGEGAARMRPVRRSRPFPVGLGLFDRSVPK